MAVVNTGRGSNSTHHLFGFPHQHLLLAAGLLLALAMLLSLGAGDVEANRKSVPLALDLETPPATTAAVRSAETANTPEIVVWQDYKVRSGDNLSLIFQRAGLDDGDVYHVDAEIH